MLKKIQLQLFTTFSFLLLTFIGTAQTFPVTISTQLTQPSPIYLSNYADATTINSPIKVQLILNDLSITNRQVRLKCYFQGNGVSFLTNDFVVGARPLHLEGGFPLQLTNIDLAPYFQFQNIQGINPNQYAQALPEGVYTFSVEVYDFATGKKLSRKTSVTTIIFQNDPPFLNLPLNNASIMQQNIQNIVFSWSSRQINVSNVEYEFALVEIWDKYTPVQNAFAYSPPLYTSTTRTTTLQYSLSEPQLIPGRRYAWRIKAKALANAEEVGVFKNNGYSEIYSFTYEIFCTAPLAIETTGINQDQAKITWSGDIANYDYEVNYREKNASSEWYKLVTPREYATISNLKPNTTYEYTVGASCDLGKYTYSNIKEFTTMASDEIAFASCGIKPDPNDLANKNPLPDLFPNDVVTAGDFPIVVLHSTGSNGTFSGDGYVTFPFLEKFRKLIDAVDVLGGEKTNIGEFSRIRITFNNIGVNTDFKLISGEIIASYDAEWGGISNLDPLIEEIFGPQGETDIANNDAEIPTEIPTEIDNTATENDNETNPSKGTDINTEKNPIITNEPNNPKNPDPIINTPPENPTANDSSNNNNSGSDTNTPKDGYFIEYKEKKYNTGDKIQIPFNRNLLTYNRFKMGKLEKDTNVKYELRYQSEGGVLAENVGGNNYLKKTESKSETNFDFSFDKTLKYQLKSIAETEKEPSISNEINLVVKPFQLVSLKAIDNSNTKRIASNGEILYYINKPTISKELKKTSFEITFTPNVPIDEIPSKSIKWKFNDTYDEKKDGIKSFKVDINENKNANVTAIAGYPNENSKNVDIKWVDEDYNKTKLTIGSTSNPFLKKALELTSLMEKTSSKLDKIPFFKRMKKNDNIDGKIGFYFDITAFEQELKNKEDKESRLYYQEKKSKGGVDIGLSGSVKQTIWGLPIDKIPVVGDKLKEYISAGIYVVGTAKTGGELKAELVEYKYVNSQQWKEISNQVNPAVIKLDVEFGVGAEVKFLKKNDYLSFFGDANGKAKAEIFTIGWRNNNFQYGFIQNGVFIDFQATLSGTFLGKKLETTPYYQRVVLVEPQTIQ